MLWNQYAAKLREGEIRIGHIRHLRDSGSPQYDAGWLHREEAEYRKTLRDLREAIEAALEWSEGET